MTFSVYLDMILWSLSVDPVRQGGLFAGVPFRETHHLSGAAVKMAEDRNCGLSDLTAQDLKTIHPSFEEDVQNVWSFDLSAENRDTEGGTSKRSVLEQAEKLKAYLKQEGL